MTTGDTRRPALASGEWADRGPHERAAEEPLDYRSQEAWQCANPGGGQIPNLTYERYREDLETDPETTEAVARRYRLNQWTDTEEPWLPAPWSSYAAPGSLRLRPAARDERRVVAGVDASTRRDSTAITVWEAEGPPTSYGCAHAHGCGNRRRWLTADRTRTGGCPSRR